MRAEDLFEAMDGIDEKLIARSDRRVRSSRKSSEQKSGKKGSRKSQKRQAAKIYRYAVIAMTAAAAVFLFLMARDFLGPRTTLKADQSVRAVSESVSESEEAVMEPDSAAEDGISEGAEEEPDADSVQKIGETGDRAAGEAEEAAAADAAASSEAEASDAQTKSAGSGKSAAHIPGR